MQSVVIFLKLRLWYKKKTAIIIILLIDDILQYI